MHAGAHMKQKKEVEIVEHSIMNHLKVFLVDMISRTPHGHDDMEIGVILDGKMDLFIEDAHYSLVQHDIYIISRYQMHSFHCPGKKAVILAFQIQDAFYTTINPRLHYLRTDCNVIRDGSGPLHQTLFSRLFSCADWYFSEKSFHDLKCASMILDVLYSLFDHSCCSIITQKEADAMELNTVRLNHFTDYIGAHYMEQISLDTLADLEHISTYYASHYFRQNLGISFQEYQANIRFQRAYYLVRHTNLNITDICLESGFSSSRYLNQMFVKKLGMTVKEYRKSDNRPRLLTPDLPSDNKQTPYSFEQSAFLLKKYHGK